ncbi:hypothetical protein PENSPDRAFT_693481 [Peniophora sp. CONT]|nr:hypothetical protein PENSPDRAFT_693481 [Peniophora sp. CONT]
MPSVQSWLAFAEQDPARVVAVLRLDEENPMTEHGDIASEIRTVLQTVLTITRDLNLKKPQYTKLWASLVKAGVADALCACIAEPSLLANSSLESIPLSGSAATTSAPARAPLGPWTPALHGLAYAAAAIKEPPTSTDKIFIGALKAKWSRMVTRIWNGPAHSLDKDPIRANERAGIAEILKKLLVADPSILSDHVFQPEDLTLPLIARQWMHSTSERDTSTTADALSQTLMSDLVPGLKEYLTEHSPPPKRQLFERILQEFQPTSGPDEALACVTFLDICAAQMARAVPLGQRHSTFELIMAFNLVREDRKPEESVFHTVLRSHHAFWKSFFNLLTRAGEPGKEKMITLMFMVETLWNIALYQRSGDNNEAGVGELYRTWVTEGYFEAVEVSLPYVLAQLQGTPKKYAVTLQGMIMYVENNPAAADLRAEMATHFPRAKTMFAMHRRDIAAHHKRGSYRKFELRVNGQLEPYIPDEDGWVHTLWQQQAELEYICKGRNLCNLRGCSNNASAKCGRCQSVKYCSQACQKRDWKEHKLICGWRHLFNECVDKAQESKALSTELGITPYQLRQLAERMQNEKEEASQALVAQ